MEAVAEDRAPGKTQESPTPAASPTASLREETVSTSQHRVTNRLPVMECPVKPAQITNAVSARTSYWDDEVRRGLCENIGGAWTGFSNTDPARHEKGNGWWFRERLVPALVKLLDLREPGLSVFESGSGCGQIVHLIVKASGARAFGVDLNEKFVRFANSAYGDTGRYCVGDVTHLPFVPSDMVMGAYSFGVFEYLGSQANICRAVHELVRITRAGGRVVLLRVQDNSHKNVWCNFGGTKLIKQELDACLRLASKPVTMSCHGMRQDGLACTAEEFARTHNDHCWYCQHDLFTCVLSVHAHAARRTHQQRDNVPPPPPAIDSPQRSPPSQ